MKIRKVSAAVMAAFLILTTLALPMGAQQGGSRAAGRFNASYYSYGNGRVPGAYIAVGETATGSQTITVCTSASGGTSGVSLPDGRTINPFAVTASIIVDRQSSTVSETVTPTAVSTFTGSPCNGNAMGAQITASFTYAHGTSLNTTQVSSGTYGAQEAVNDAFAAGGGVVSVDPSFGGTDATLYGLVPYPSVSIEDTRKGAIQYWNLASNTTALATPAVLTAQLACDTTHTTCSDASVAGSASWGSTVYCGITYLDLMGNESLTSTTASWTSAASKAIDIGAPIASTGAIAWKPYCSVSGGTYALAYSLPLLTQPTVLQAVPVSSGVCRLSTILMQIGIAACDLVNATYGTASSATGAAGLFSAGGAQFTGYPVVTSILAPNLDSASSQSLNPSNGGHTVYKYVPGSHVGIPGVMSFSQPFPVTTAAQTTVGQVEGTIKMPANFMNYVGRTIRVCGLITKTSTTADTVDNIELQWDAEGSNVTAGTAVLLSNIKITEATALTAAADFHFCQDITTTVASATATGGTIVPGGGFATVSQVSAGANPSAGANSVFAAVGSLNLALPANLEIVLVHTTGTDGAGSILVNPTVQIIN